MLTHLKYVFSMPLEEPSSLRRSADESCVIAHQALMEALAFATIERATGGIRRYPARLGEEPDNRRGECGPLPGGELHYGLRLWRIVLWQGLSTH
jgi:hypothetical protein